MKTRLDQLTTSEFIDLVCGNKDVLLGKHEVPNQNKVTIAMRNIVLEYRSIADPGGNATYIQRVENIIRARLGVAVYSMCQNLVTLYQFEKAREVLIAADAPAETWDEKRIKSEVHIRLQKAKRAFEEIDDDKDSDDENKEDIRNAFNAMIAAMMAHFKFQIDVATMMAPVFAHLVARYHEELKAMKNAFMKH